MIEFTLNGHKFQMANKQEVASFLLKNLFDPYMSYEALVIMITGVMDMLGLRKKLKYIPETLPRLHYFIYDAILSGEGHGRLPGFSCNCSIEKGFCNYNPEKISLKDPKKGGV